MGVRSWLGLSESGASPSQAIERRTAAAEANVELLTESLADLELALEDQGWESMLGGATREFSRAGLTRAARLARIMAIAHPLIKRGLAIRSAYVWGGGVQIQARAGADADQDVNAVVQAFLDDPGNRAAFTGGQARATAERTLGTDGNVFPVCFSNPKTGFVQVRTLPFDEITDVITNPDDRNEPWFFVRTWSQRDVDLTTGATSTTTKTAYYPALGFWPRARPQTINGQPVMWDARVYQVAVNGLDGWAFGIGDAYAALPWARLYRDFLADWAVLVKSLSQFAWRLAAKGSKSQRLRQAMTRRPSAAAPDGNPNTVGATVNLPPDATLEAIPKTGATIDSDSGRPLAAMIAAALGVPVTALLSDPGVTGARATAETLDKHTENEMGERRGVWEEAYRAILAHVIAEAVRAPKGPLRGTVQVDTVTGRRTVTLVGDVDSTVEFSWPDLTDTPVETLVKAIVEADSTGKLPPVEVAKLLLHALGVKDVDELVAGMVDDQGRFIDPAATAGQAAIDAYRAGLDPTAVV